jgi:endonuclease/exonuclease/phosphatase family metal-dependent hydrolase
MDNVTEGNPRWLLAIALMLLACLGGGLAVWLLAGPTRSLPPLTSPTSESTSAQEGTAGPSGQPTPNGCARTAPLRAMTFNIHHAARHGDIDLEQIAREIEAVDPDVVALQEVDRHNPRSAYVDQARWLGRRLGLTPLFGVNRVRVNHGWTPSMSEYGNALLTRLPVLDQRNLRLPNLAHLEHRGLLLATLDLDGIELVVASTHFQHRPPQPRVLQAGYVVRALATQSGPRLLMGDLNDEPSTWPLRILRSSLHDLWAGAGTGPGFTHPRFHADRRIDFVLGDDGIRARQAGVLVSRVSDHRAVWADVRVTGPVPCISRP